VLKIGGTADFLVKISQRLANNGWGTVARFPYLWKAGFAMLADALSRFNFGELMGFLAVGGGLLIGLVAIVGGFWVESRKTEINAALKHEMLSRGMAADEIKMVLDAGTNRSEKGEHSHAGCA
jgi:hypothetical protein